MKAILKRSENEECNAQCPFYPFPSIAIQHGVEYDFMYDDSENFYLVVDGRVYSEQSTAFDFIRTLKDLLILVRDSLACGHKEFYFNNGICGEISNLESDGILTRSELLLLGAFIRINRPNACNHSEFINSEYWKGNYYWWDTMRYEPQTRQIRIDFLNKLINLQP